MECMMRHREMWKINKKIVPVLNDLKQMNEVCKPSNLHLK